MKKIPEFDKVQNPIIKMGQFGMIRYGSRYFYRDWPRAIFMEWYNCRDSFHYNFDQSWYKQFFYACPYETVRDVIGEVENELGLTFKSKIRKCDVKDVVWIKPARFWRAQPIRLSLFTILLRAAQHYEGDLDKMIMADGQASNTKEAIDYFLSRHCYYTGSEKGWYQQFDTRYLLHKKKKLDSLLSTTSLFRELKLTLFG
jgi:hypothetical protein